MNVTVRTTIYWHPADQIKPMKAEVTIPLGRTESDEPFLVLANKLREQLGVGPVQEVDRHALIRNGVEGQ